jgi:hypothetical protein
MITVKIAGREFSLTKVIAGAFVVLATVSGAITYGKNVLPYASYVVPSTRVQHRLDVAALQARIAELENQLNLKIDTSLMAATGATEDFRAEWKCDEYREELNELIDAQDRGDRSERTRKRVEDLEKLMMKYNCVRFDD